MNSSRLLVPSPSGSALAWERGSDHALNPKYRMRQSAGIPSSA
ncbi:MAG: hypothetical protein WCR07_02620 [Verrucomicrobiota bacterium]